MTHNYILGRLLTLMLLLTATGFAQNVTSIYPTQNAINIPTDANLMVGFDMIITPTIFNNATIVVTSAQTGVVSGTFSGINSNIITFNPTQDFQPGELITIVISNPVGRIVLTFTTAVSPESPGEFSDQNIINNNADGAFSVFSADLDGDGDLDVVSASFNDNKIAWYENDGAGNFGTEQVLNTSLDTAYAVLAADIDGDGDMDIVSGSAGDDKVAWYENDGTGNFGPEQLITTIANLTRKIFVADMDGDGDLDVLSNIANVLKIRWYENSNAGTTWTERQVELSTLPTSGSHMCATDLDNDGDMDIVLLTNGLVVWYENDGSGTVSAQQLIGAMSNVTSLITADINADGFQDIIIGTQNDGLYKYLNNGDSSFEPAESITGPINRAYHLNTADIDGDGDMDIFVAGYLANNLVWFENDGSGNFGAQQIISTAVLRPTHIHLADLDGDGDMDVLSTSANDNKVAWYENVSSTLSMHDTPFDETIIVYPNPASNHIILQNQNNLNLQQLLIYDLRGRLVKTVDLQNTINVVTIDISELEVATYVLNIITDNDSITKQVIIK